MSFFFSILLIVIALYFAINWSNSKNSANNSKKSSRGYSKWVGGGLGWAFGGPIGALLGFTFGKIFEDLNTGSGGYHQTRQGDFNISLLVLSAAVMKADGSVKRSELDYVKAFLVRNFGPQKAEEYLLMLREILKQDINVREVSIQIGQFMEYPSKLQLLHYLFGVSSADSILTKEELDMISVISGFLGIQPSDFASIKAMFIKDTDNAYKILDIPANSSEEVIKKAYREMAMKYHPDKVNHLGEDVRKSAEEKFRTIADAYEIIKKQRGIK
ncbi:MAG: molecular chaperone DjlA [Bacteroidetes bacterium HGW-Bacteroidetes-1]|jgi:DnaJ like chaperone protein|nr:MAG: molecular chaperone DjlA [Bacteroidetes bacterium HGW-Bacteroidetes-1]